MYIYVYVHIYRYIDIYIYLYTYIHIYRNTYIDICIYTYIYVHTHMYIPLELIIRGAMIAVSFFCHGRLKPLESRVKMKSLNDIHSVEKRVYLLCGMTRSYLHMTYSYLRHDSFVSAIRLVHIRSKRTASITDPLSGNVGVLLCDITNSYLRHVSFISAT